MSGLELKHIASFISTSKELISSDRIIDNLLLDSRKYISGDGYLFFALKGENHDGHIYIKDLYIKGVRDFVVEQIPEGLFTEANFLLVPDSLKALQELAKRIRESSSAKIIAITGSNGKTIVKEWLAQVLNDHFKTYKNPKSYNSQVGVPLSVWGLREKDEIGIFEAGISQPKEMKALENILEPEIGIFTNIGSAHEQFFESRPQKVEEKLKLFKNSTKVIYCQDYSLIREAIEKETDFEEKYISWSVENKGAKLFITDIDHNRKESKISGIYNGDKISISILFTDKASVENAIHVWLCGLLLNISPKDLESSFLSLEPVAMRLEMKSGLKDSIIINDVYNSDLESLNIALNFLEQQAQNREKVVVLSDILQSGLSKEDLYTEVASIFKNKNIDKWVAIGENLSSCKSIFSDQVDFYLSTADFLSHLNQYSWENKAILLKGARAFCFEEISQRLEQKSHETVLEIHLSSLVHNLNYYRSKLKAETKVMAMVKAFSYGSGSYEIASLLQFHKVDYLAVAYTDEGVELRKAGITLPVMVLNAEPSSFPDIIEYNLQPEIYSFRLLHLFSEAILKSDVRESYPIHLKMDTGMHRLGFSEDEVSELIQQLSKFDHLDVISIFSHLAASDELDKDVFTNKQIQLFKGMSSELETGLGKILIKHIVNSAGISNYADAHFDMVRLGIGLYGISASIEERKSLQAASELKASISQIKTLKAGETVGYGLSYTAQKRMSIAVITLGYADGLRRSLSNGQGRVWVKGNYYPIVGKVCMDMTMIDITGSNLQEGDEVEIIGQHVNVYELASKMDTIPYEVLTGISQRVKRVYYME